MEQQSSPSSTKRMRVTTYIPEEIVIDILARLPVRSLPRCKCVSKYWKTLISGQEFKQKHLNHHNKKIFQSLLVSPVNIDDHTFSTSISSLSSISTLSSDQTITINDAQKLVCPFVTQPRVRRPSKRQANGIEIYCYFDGLFILKPRLESIKQPTIWNPATADSKLLPKDHDYPLLRATAISYGLGYDSACDEYKVLKVGRRSRGSEVKILSLKSYSWKRITGELSSKNDLFRMSGLIFVNGGFHWLAFDSRKSMSPQNSEQDSSSLTHVVRLISVSISNEMYGEVPLPKPYCSISRELRYFSGLAVLRGKLCVYYNVWEEKAFTLWEMKEYGVEVSWTKSFSIPWPETLAYMIPRYMFQDGELLLYCQKLREGKWIGTVSRTSKGAYGLSNRECLLLHEETYQDVYVYTESFTDLS